MKNTTLFIFSFFPVPWARLCCDPVAYILTSLNTPRSLLNSANRFTYNLAYVASLC